MDTADAKKTQRRPEVKLHNRIDLLEVQGATHLTTVGNLTHHVYNRFSKEAKRGLNSKRN